MSHDREGISSDRTTAASSCRSRLLDWWYGGFGWCRFLGHQYDADAGECLRCGAVPSETAYVLTGERDE